MTCVTAKPSRAWRIAGASTLSSGSLPKRLCSSAQPSTQPGTDTEQRAAAGDVFQVAVLELFERETARAAAAGVEAVEFFGFGVPDDGEQVAAEAAAHGLGHAEHGVGGDGGVDRVAAGLQDLDGGLGRERLAGGRHAVFADGGRASDE